MALTNYQQQVARLLHDPNNQAYPLADITTYINTAREEVAEEGECLQVLIAGGTITNLAITAGGAGYVSPTVTITGSGAQAFATATQSGGVINTVTLISGGWGYIPAASTVVTVTDTGPGAGAILTPSIDNSATTVTGQEVTRFATLNGLLAAWNAAANPPQQATLGCSAVFKIISIACNQSGTYKPMLTEKIWSEFQAYLRIYSNTQQNFPIYWAQFGQGQAGSFYLFPWPSQPLQMDVQACVTPIDLVNDATIEALQKPWTLAIPYYAAYLAYENSSRKEDADRMFKMYELFMQRARAKAERPFMPDYYGYEY
jgi:hypothetical protein